MLNPGPTLTEHQAYLKDNPIMIKTIDETTLQETGSFLRYDGKPEAGAW
jgi:hypothetical protein